MLHTFSIPAITTQQYERPEPFHTMSLAKLRKHDNNTTTIADKTNKIQPIDRPYLPTIHPSSHNKSNQSINIPNHHRHHPSTTPEPPSPQPTPPKPPLNAPASAPPTDLAPTSGAAPAPYEHSCSPRSPPLSGSHYHHRHYRDDDDDLFPQPW